VKVTEEAYRSRSCELIPQLYDSGQDWVVNTKKRYNCFVETDLDFLLHTHGINTLLLTGVNTNSRACRTMMRRLARPWSWASRM
jgi:nicotinamidase-related amidase